jgi:uncharacterized protein YgiM (DUF1202 family)
MKTRWIRSAFLLGAALLAGLGGCATGSDDAEVYQRAEAERVEYLEREVARLRADVDQAEEAMIWIESGLRGVHTRADAVSAVADARVVVERACERAPWRAPECEADRAKLAEAETQIRDGRLGTAVFFASRARRSAETALGEASRVSQAGDAWFVRNARVNLRSGPSTEHEVLTVLREATPVFEERRAGDWVLVRTHAGRVGWVHAGLLRASR